MIKAGLVLCILSILVGIIQIRGCVKANYEYENEIGSFWELSDKSSTLSEKSMYINQFLEALQKSKHEDFDAVTYKTPTVSFDKNIRALSSLKDRLETIKGLDEKSFEYQTAISQITAQEQGEARRMLSVFEGCWLLRNYWYVWDWYGFIIGSLWCIFLTLGVILVLTGFAYF